ncbi:non-ribosomal peptide synthetase [Chondromyces crocatus]|uniref:Carrier domain-containing protein n=1 Tax=Chondromyces crocatus TaxID=52 RepID=A0A0K1E9X7_CHOCO|nr:non-ribosomal peptide synthetase [Chondromyces crocatus]AKT37644.1 uncharacterized protein CMC5_017860 [Chondromyces crocatus]
MSLTQFLSNLSQLGVSLWIEGDRLRIRARKDVLTPSLRSELEARREEILAFLSHQKKNTSPQGAEISVASRDGDLKLSSGQLRFWVLDKLVPDSPLYNLFFGIRMSGPLDVSALERSVTALVTRHEVLRTVFPESNGQPRQVVLAPDAVVISHCDLTHVNEADHERALAERCSMMSRETFELARGPLLQLALVRLGPEDHALLVLQHHIISDAWSIGAFVGDLVSLYRALSAGQTPALPPLPIQYADYAQWQRARGAEMDEHRRFWGGLLAGIPRLNMPTDKPRTGNLSHRGGAFPVALPADLSDALKALVKREECTLFVALLAAYGALLHRCTGQTDFAIGTEVANRDRPELRPLIGYFVNTLALRLDFSGDPTFTELLARARTTSMEAFAHAELPFDEMVEAARVPREGADNPLFQVNLALESIATPDLEMPGMRWRPFSGTLDGSVEGTSKFELNLIVSDSPEGIAGVLEHSTDLFDTATIARWVGHLHVLLRGIVDNPGRRLSELPLLSEEERHRALVTWNATQADFPDPCLHELFEQQVVRTPDAEAVVFGQRRMSYRELNRRSNQLARILRERGARPNTLVAAVLDKGWEQVVAVLAILKAGAAYVPIDPHLPPERLRHLLEHGQVQLALTQAVHDAELTFPEGVLRFTVDVFDPTDDDDRNLDRVQGPEDLAYVIYTSGSTGLPKGVVLDHRGPANTILDLNEQFHVGPGDKVLALSALNFDLSVYDIFGLLAAGGTVVLPEPSALREPSAWAALLVAERVTIWNTVPALMEMLVDHASGHPEARIDTLRAVFMSGDWIPVTLPDRIKRLVPGAAVISMGGATEASIWSIQYPIEHVDPSWRSIPYGRPMRNQRFYVLDQALEPCPVGVEGALFIGGVGLAKGYWREEALSAASFIVHPRTGEQIYRTGDQGRYFPDGTIEFLGRRDFQVKIRGFRIELGEIESTLMSHPGVREAVVLAREDVPGDKRLVGYVVPQVADGLDPADLRALLKDRLPEYMLPSVILLIEAMPLTSNGKVDRRALPAPNPSGGGTDAEFTAPRTPTETLVAGLWADVLGVPQVSIHDDFFMLGGHSLVAIQAIGRLRSAQGFDLPLRALFEAPTVAAFSQRLDDLRRAKQGSTSLPLRRMERPAVLPLSLAQQRFWFLDQLAPGGHFYNVPAGFWLRGPLDPSLLERSVHAIAARHEALRTTFPAIEGQPQQRIAPEPTVALKLVDLSHLVAEARHIEVKRLAADAIRCPFDLAGGPLVRWLVIRLADEEHLLVLTMHHIISDGWSVGLLLQELTALYAAFRSGAPSPLPELQVQYADYVLWQRQWLDGEVREHQLAYWKQKLAGVPTALELPTDRPRPPVQRFQGAVSRFELPIALTAAITALSTREGATPFMTLLAAFNVVLSRYAGVDDLCVGTPVAGRNHAELAGLVGLFVNTLVLRTDLSGDPSFLDLVRRVRDTLLEAHEHQDVPFDQVVDALQAPRDLSRTPLFQVLFVFQEAPPQDVKAADLSVSLLDGSTDVDLTIAKFDLTLGLEKSERGMCGWLEYNTDLFDAATIDRMAGHFRTLIEGAVAAPEARISALPMLTTGERHQILGVWNDTAVDHGDERCMHALFEAQAARTPDAVAVLFEGEQLTYAELNQRANRLAHHLRDQGVGPGVLVGICAERSPELPVALFGVLKAGGAYVPLDPAYPRDRLAFMLEDTRAPLLLTQRRLLSSLPEHTARVLCLDDLGDALVSVPDEDLPSRAAADDLCYVIYTSGSTGRPKGVAISHRAIGNHMRWMQATHPLLPTDRTLQKTAFSFDAAGKEFFATLCAGATLVLPRADGHRDSAYLVRMLAEHRITFLQVVPSLLKVLLEEAEITQCTELRWLYCAGEALSVELTTRLFERLPQVRLVNTYGPTEASIDVTSWTCARGPLPPAIPIGQPMANTRIHILGPHLELVPIGVPGELYIGGTNLARGYVNRPALTADRFVVDPHCASGERLYRTGDRVRRLADGTLDFLGRIDNQVKLRGFRIELGEIETALERLPGVLEAVVTVREDVPGDRRLVAHVAQREHADLSGADLRQALGATLPEYMVPAAFVLLDALPKTPNGKVDRNRLPAPDWAHRDPGATFVAPRTPVEDVLASVWSEVLGVPRVGVHDDFFSLGGHSLLATQAMARLRACLGVELPLRALFEAPTVAALAERVEASRRTDAGMAISPLVRPPRDGELPLSFAQQRLWFLDQLEQGSPVYNLPAAVRLKGSLDAVALERSLVALGQRHETLRTSFASRQGKPFQVIASEPALRVERIDLGHLTGADQEVEVARLTRKDALRPFHLGSGPFLRVTLLALSADEHVLLLNMHHIVSDGWSIGVLVRELSALYAAFSADRVPELPELPIQYADFAQWQRDWLEGEVLDGQLAYWKQQLGGGIPALELPTDRPRPPTQTFRGAVLPVALPPALADALRALCRREGVTLYMALLAGFQALLHRVTGQDDIAIGSPIAGRTRAETEGLIGLFINTLVLRTRLSPELSFRELLRRVREVTLGAYDHQDVPFEKLVDALQPERDLSRSPLFQVMLILQNAPQPVLDLPGLTAERMELSGATSKFDLTLSLEDSDEGLRGWIEYNTDLFDAATMTRLMGHLQTLLEGAVTAPAQHLAELPILPPEERQLVVHAWNDTAVAFPEDLCVHERIAEQAARTPDAPAVIFEDRMLSYAELDRRSNQLAHHLRALGVGPERLVGVCMERSLELVVALLGVLKAGGAYVPLDPTYPAERLDFMLGDIQAKVILTQERLLAERALPGTHVLCLDAAATAAALATAPTSAPPRVASDDQLAYVIYTSGSTGRPKGAMNTHRGLRNRLLWMQQAYGLTEADAVCQKTPYSFDVSVWEFFWPLMTGARLVVARPGGHRDTAYLAELFSSQRVTTAHFVPSMLAAFVEEPSLARCTHLKRVICSGEALPFELVERFLAQSPAELHNLYGPTEASIDVTFHACQRADARRIVPIGRPIANTRIVLLDARLDPVPVGVPGELFIGGVGVGRGYVHRASLTAERFLPDPLATTPGERLYRTGDRARWLPTGELEYLGRTDHQVKLRGFRIELSEIEAVLAQHPGVREAVVLAREDRPRDVRLVAYVVASATEVTAGEGGAETGRSTAPSTTALREHLRTKLPEYMIPTAFVRLDAMPLTPSGKADRRALPAPDAAQAEERPAFVAPRTATEQALADIWTEVLQVERVGIHDSFFALGGHSLLATQVVARARDTFAVEVPLRAIFESPVLADMASLIVSCKAEQVDCGDLSEMLESLDDLSEEEVMALLAEGGGGETEDALPLDRSETRCQQETESDV